MRGKRCVGRKLLLLPFALLAAGPAAAEDAPASASAPGLPATMLVLDASRSMWAKVGATSKMGVLRASLGNAAGDYQDKIALGLVAFGHRQSSSCGDSQVLAKPGELNAKTQSKLLFGFKPKAQKPIAASLEAAAKAGQQQGGKLDIVLITDGPDSCKADICTTAQALKQTSPGLRIHVLAFAAKPGDDVKSLSCIAEASGGKFITATNADELKHGLTSLLDAIATPAAPATAAAPQGQGGAAVPAPSPASSQHPADATPAQQPGGPGDNVGVAAEGSQSAGPAQVEPPSGPPAPSPPAQAEPAQTGQANAAAPAEPPPPAAPSPATPAQTELAKSPAPAPAQVAAQTPPSPAQPSLPVPCTFKALLTDAGPKLQSGLIWRVFDSAAAADGSHKLLSTHREAMPTAALLPGEYLVNAAYGLSNLTKKIKVESGRSIEETFVLNTGGLKLAAVLANGEALPQEGVHFDILSDEEDQFGNRHKILGDAKPGLVIRLNAGAYHIVSLYGDANATVRVDVTVEPGKLTEATVKHAASKVTFKLVQGAGGEALADTQWSILTKSGDVVKENAGALPTHILAAGSYAVVARHGGASYSRSFDVGMGEAKQIEVVMDEGPASPETLRAITNPPPPPTASDEDASGTPAQAETGMGFGGDAPKGSGLLVNPGALLHPRAP